MRPVYHQGLAPAPPERPRTTHPSGILARAAGWAPYPGRDDPGSAPRPERPGGAAYRLAEALGVPAERLAEGVDDPAEQDAEGAEAMA